MKKTIMAMFGDASHAGQSHSNNSGTQRDEKLKIEEELENNAVATAIRRNLRHAGCGVSLSDKFMKVWETDYKQSRVDSVFL